MELLQDQNRHLYRAHVIADSNNRSRASSFDVPFDGTVEECIPFELEKAPQAPFRTQQSENISCQFYKHISEIEVCSLLISLYSYFARRRKPTQLMEWNIAVWYSRKDRSGNTQQTQEGRDPSANLPPDSSLLHPKISIKPIEHDIGILLNVTLT